MTLFQDLTKGMNVIPDAESIPVGNSEHPVLPFVVGGSLRPVSRLEGGEASKLHYIFVKPGPLRDEESVVTYREQDHSLQWHDMPHFLFKKKVKNKEPLDSVYEIEMAPGTDKYIGNAIMNLLDGYVIDL